MQEAWKTVEVRKYLCSRRAHLLTTHKVGGGIPSVGRARALCEAGAAPAGALWTMLHFCETAIIVRAVDRRTAFAMLADRVSDEPHLPVNCLQKPATGSFIAEMGIVVNPHLLFQKSNKNKSERTVMKNGDLSSGSKSH